MTKPLRHTLNLQFVLVALLPIGLIATLIWFRVVPALVAETEARNHALAVTVADRVARYLDGPYAMVDALRRAAQEDKGASDLTPLLDGSVEAGGVFDAIYITDRNARVRQVGLTPERRHLRGEYLGLDLSARPFIRRAIDDKRPVWSATFLSSVSGRISVAVAIPYLDGIAAGEVDLYRLSDFVRGFSADYGLLVAVIDQRGQVVAHPLPEASAESRSLSHLPIVAAWLAGTAANPHFDLDGVAHIGSLARLNDLGWAVLVSQPESVAYDQIRATRNILLLGVAGALLLAVCAAILLARRFARPIEALAEHARVVADGEYGAAPAASQLMEFDALAETLERMAAAVQDRERRLAASEQRYRDLVERTDDLIASFDPDGHLRFVNHAVTVVLGLRPEECRGRSLLDFVHIEDRDATRAAIAAACAGAERSMSFENRLVSRSGESHPMLWTLNPQRHVEGGTAEISGIARDIGPRKAAEEALKHSEAQVRLLLNSAGEGIYGVDREGRCTFINAAGLAILGYERADELVGKSTHLSFHHHRRDGAPYPEAECRLLQVLHTLEPLIADDDVFWRRDGKAVPVEYRALPIIEDGKPTGTVCAFHDITARREAEAELRLAATVFENTVEGVIITDAEKRVIAVNPASERITGYDKAELIGGKTSLPNAGHHDEQFLAELWATLARDGHWSGETWNRRKNGEIYPQWLSISAVRDETNAVTHYVGVFNDITSMKQSQERLDYLAHHDPLTGLPNRLVFNDRLGHSIRLAERERSRLAVLFIDLDQFKIINDSLGHHVGDELLKQIANLLGDGLRAGDTLARLGGDEFVVLAEGLEDPRAAGTIAEKILASLTAPLTIGGAEMYVGASIGIAIYPSDGTDAPTLVKNADAAMYRAKQEGRRAFRFYASDMTEAAAERLRLEALLRRAMEHNELHLHYQPQVDMQTGTLVGAEALARWRHPQLGVVPPARFVPVAEESGFIHDLGEWVLRTACRQMKRWDAAGLRVPLLAVNVSAKQVQRSGFVERVTAVLAETGLEPARLELEITESVIMHAEATLEIMQQLRTLGVRLAVDDFGTGYSSLAYLKRLPIHQLKIDRSFVQAIARDANDEAITVAVIALAESLGLTVIAEGVENEQQVEFLLRHRCRLGQGFLFDHPAEAEEFYVQWISPERYRA